MNKKGFTLLELLIAAVILGILSAFATISYRKTMVEAHIQEGKNRVRAVASAVQRFKMDNPSFSFAGGTQLEAGKVNCNLQDENKSAQQLVNCGYIDNRPWSDEYVTIEVCGSNSSYICGKSDLTNKLVCMTGVSNKNTAFKGTSAYFYCESATSKQEKLNGTTTTSPL